MKRLAPSLRIFCLGIALVGVLINAGCVGLAGKPSTSGGGGGSTSSNPTPEIDVTPPSINFGAVVAGSTDSQSLRLSNPGTADLTVSQVTTTGGNFSVSGIAFPLTVAAGGSVNFTTTYRPTAAGNPSGTITITSNAPGSPMTIDWSAAVQAATFVLSPTPSGVNFGTVTDGTTATQIVNLINTGNSNVSITSAIASGTGFSASGGSNVTLTPTQSVTVTVSFDPQSTGSLSGTLSVSSNAPVLQIPLSGTGTQASQHTVSLSWTPSTSQVIGYYVYRGTAPGGPYSRVNSSVDPFTTYADSTVAGGQSYYYVVTSVDSGNVESVYSNQVETTIPSS
jgi:hypothetical protein